MIRTVGLRRMLPAVAVASSIALIASGCSSDEKGAANPGGDGTSAAADDGRVLNVWAGSQTPIVANFNPFMPNAVLHATQGPILESLYYFNKVADAAPTPILGTGYEWNEDGTEMTIKVREGVKWNDGEPFTAKDVAFTYNYEIAKPTYLDNAEATDDTTVVLTFNVPSFTNEATLLSMFIVPEHIWSNVADAATETNVNPVGTGAYMVESVSEAAYVLVANPNYWQEGKPAVKKVRYLALNSNQTSSDLLTTGQLDWAGMFSPDPSKVTGSGTLSMLNTPVDPTVLYTCSNADLGCEGAQTDVAVRQAINAAIDRATLNDKAWAGQAKAISPTFALLGRDDKWIADGIEKESPQTANAAEAGAILEAAGYAKGSDGIYAKDGAKVEMTLSSVDGWTDYNDAAKLIAEQAAAAGIKITPMQVTWDEFAEGRSAGTYQLIMGGVIGSATADPYSVYHDWFTTDTTTPVGTAIESGDWNFARYSNPEVDAAVLTAGGTLDVAAKQAAYAIVQENIVRDLPYIPIVVNATQTFMNTKDFTGWPTESNMYAFPPSWASVGAGLVLADLKPVS